MKKIIIICFILMAILSVGAATAADVNTTDDATPDIGMTQDMQIGDTNTPKNDTGIDISIKNEIFLYEEYSEHEPQFFPTNWPSDFNGIIKTYVDEEYQPNYNITKNTDFVKFNLAPLGVGVHNFTFISDGDENYNPFKITKFVNITDIYIGATTGDVMADDAYVRVCLSPDAMGYVTVTIDGKQAHKIDVSKIEGSWENKDVRQRLNLAFGLHDVKVTYADGAKQTTKKFKINIIYEMYVKNQRNTYAVKYGQIQPIVVPEGITDNVSVEIDGKKYPVEYDKTEKQFNLDIQDLTLGSHNVSITYAGDKNFPKQTFTETIEVIPCLIINNMVNYGDKNSSVSLRLPKDAEGNLSVNLTQNKKNIFYESKRLVGGFAEIDLPLLPVQLYEFQIKYTGQDYNYTFNNDALYVFPKVVMPSQIRYGDNLLIEVTGDNKTNGFLYVCDEEFGQELDWGMIINGTGNISTKKLKIGTYDLWVYFGSYDFTYFYDGDYLGPIWTQKITIQALPCKIANAKSTLSMYYGDGTTYKVKLYDETGQLAKNTKASITIGSEKYTGQTDSKGVLTVKFDQNPGKYTLKISYKTASAKTTVNIKKILTLNTVKVKKSAQKLVLTAKLAKKLKGKTITFKFNGKTYKAKTDKNGVAKYTIKKTVLNKLKVGKKVAYQATYLKNTVKKTAKVLK